MSALNTPPASARRWFPVQPSAPRAADEESTEDFLEPEHEPEPAAAEPELVASEPVTSEPVATEVPAPRAPHRLGDTVRALRELRLVDASREFGRALAVDSLLRNSLAIMANTVVTSALGYVFWVIAAHLFTTRQVGLTGALISVVTVVSILANLGLGQGLVERLPASPDDEAWTRTLNAALITATLAGAVAGVIAVLGLPLLGHDFHELRSLPIATMFVVGSAAWTGAIPLDYVFIAERSTGGLVIRNAVLSLARFAFLLGPLLLGSATTSGLFASWTFAAVFAMFFGVFVLVPRLRRSYRLRWRGVGRELRSMKRSLVGHHLTTIGFILPTWLLPVIVVNRLSARDNAYFYLTWLVGGVFFMVSPSVAASLFAEGSHDRVSIRRQARRSAVIIAGLLAGPMVVMVVAGRLVLRVFGSQYPSHGYLLLVVLVLSAVPDAITNVAVAVMRVEGRLRRSTFLTLSMSALALVLAWFLLPPLGIVGAGVAWLVAQSAGSVYVLGDVVLRGRDARKRPSLVKA